MACKDLTLAHLYFTYVGTKTGSIKIRSLKGKRYKAGFHLPQWFTALICL